MPIRQHRPRRRNCDECKQPFMTERAGQKVCCPIPCGRDYAIKQREKKEKKQSAIDRKAKAARKKADREKLKTRSDYLKECQVAFNAWVRERDYGLPCISCDRPLTAKHDAGHYRSVGSNPALRFDPDNCHAQCVHCNQHKSGNAIEYRITLVRKIGLARVERLEGPHEPKHYTIPELQELTKHYRAEARRLKKEREGMA